ncbi:MAG TPA: hypothetical protein VNU95_12505 [Candidatus Acidoferrales bacterium]|jgi:hypothetical protein|nr:hypothetical protein [Candidatus Acidoferrales bacterium]
MKEENVKAVGALREKIRAKEDEIRQLKIVVNGFFTDEGEAAPYQNVSAEKDSSATLGSLSKDRFYGKTLAEAAQEYLQMRKASGLSSASVNDIYAALKAGGYAFKAANDDYAKNGVRISLRKTPSIFHQLPGGDYGLCVWYDIKDAGNEAHSSGKRGSKRRKKTLKPKPIAAKPENSPAAAQNGAHDTKEVMRKARGVATSTGVVTVGDLETFVREKDRRVKVAAEHFNVAEATITGLLEPASKVYKAERGWLKVRD